MEVWTKGGLVTRHVHFAGCTANPDNRWMKQVARNLADADDGFLTGKRVSPELERAPLYPPGVRSLRALLRRRFRQQLVFWSRPHGLL